MSPDDIKAAYAQAKAIALETCVFERDRLQKAIQRFMAALTKIGELSCVTGQSPCKDKTCARCIASKALDG